MAAVDVSAEGRQNKRWTRAGRIADGGIPAAIERSGGEFLGFSFKYSEWESLLVVRAHFPAGPMVCFVSGSSLAGCVVQAYERINGNALQWKSDRFAGKRDKIEVGG